ERLHSDSGTKGDGRVQEAVLAQRLWPIDGVRAAGTRVLRRRHGEGPHRAVVGDGWQPRAAGARAPAGGAATAPPGSGLSSPRTAAAAAILAAPGVTAGCGRQATTATAATIAIAATRGSASGRRRAAAP